MLWDNSAINSFGRASSNQFMGCFRIGFLSPCVIASKSFILGMALELGCMDCLPSCWDTGGGGSGTFALVWGVLVFEDLLLWGFMCVFLSLLFLGYICWTEADMGTGRLSGGLDAGF